ncbi:keratinocyte proline-rich protein-like isoform X3 [Electrophorus electricus]|uniref:keratinocyte proline-rich protein-like isoform X3 n=1 Tax=Electrophorus electricus TaxID=8005 RepID=UPI0015D0041D|nr:keratinocyte proline-rich protein-like isoform X3 [Electrophorus electricus]
MQQEGFGPSHRVQSSPVQQPSRHTTRDTGLLPEAELGYMKTLLSMLKDGKPLVLPSLMATPSRRDTTSPGPGARDAAHPCPGPVPGAREAARPDPVPAPGVRNAARPDPAPSARDATCPDQVLVPGTRDTAHPGPVPGLVVAACFCCQFCLGSCLWLQACSCEHSETRYPAMWHCYFLTCPSAYIHAYCVPCSCSYVGRT